MANVLWEIISENWIIILGIIGLIGTIFGVGKVWGKRGVRIDKLEEDVKKLKELYGENVKSINSIDKCLGKLEVKTTLLLVHFKIIPPEGRDAI